MWTISEDSFDPKQQHHHETIFTSGNGFLSTRGAFEEGYPNDRRATFIHGVFDAAPIVVTELANAPDWLPLSVYANGERFSLDSGQVDEYQRTLDLSSGLLTRRVRWRSPAGLGLTLQFERFASLADPHTLLLRCRIEPDFAGDLQVRAALDGNSHNDALLHWQYRGQCYEPGTGVVSLHNRTRQSGIEAASAMRLVRVAGEELGREYWDADNRPTLVLDLAAAPGQAVIVDKYVAIFTSRDVLGDQVTAEAVRVVSAIAGWDQALAEQTAAWRWSGRAPTSR